MKYSVVFAAAALVASATAQLGSIPSCALQCALNSLGSTGCQQTDIPCICKASSFIEALTPCVQKACTAAELQQTIKAASGLCAQAGVSLSIPGAASTAAPSATESAPAPTSAATTAAATTTESMTQSSTVVAPTTMYSAASTSAAATASSASNTTASTSLPSASPTGAAGRNTVAVGGLAAVLAFAAALL